METNLPETTVDETTTALDPASVLIKRIRRIVKATNCTQAQAVWAILRTESGYPNPYQEPFPE